MDADRLGRLVGVGDLAARLDEVERSLVQALESPTALAGPSRRVTDAGGKRIRPALTIACAGTGTTRRERTCRMVQMIEEAIGRWHQHLRGEFPGGLDELLADDVVFYSPFVFTPQRGKAITKQYLQAAAATLPGLSGGSSSNGGDGGFRYTKQVLTGDTAMLEFETTVQGKYVNGVDIIRVDESGRIIEFRVMIRPLQAVNIMHEQMRAALEAMQ